MSDQLAIDFARTHARATDPETSRIAATSMRKAASPQCAKVLNALKTMGPASASQLAERTGMTQVQVCRRLPDLESASVIRVTDETRKTVSGRPERIWIAL